MAKTGVPLALIYLRFLVCELVLFCLAHQFLLEQQFAGRYLGRTYKAASSPIIV